MKYQFEYRLRCLANGRWVAECRRVQALAFWRSCYYDYDYSGDRYPKSYGSRSKARLGAQAHADFCRTWRMNASTPVDYLGVL